MGATAKIVTEGGRQVVVLPEGFHLSGTELEIRREGDKVILEPVRRKPDLETWLALMEKHRTGDFPEVDHAQYGTILDLSDEALFD